MSPHHRFTTALAAALAAVIVCSPVTRADILVLTPTHDSYIRASQGNQGSNNLVLVGDTATTNDYLRAALAFDLSDPVLAGATINSVTLTLKIRDKKDDTSPDQPNVIDLHQLTASFTNGGVTWTSRDGTNNWTNTGGDFGAALVSLAANAGTVNVSTSFDFTSAALTTAGAGAVGGSLYLIAKLETEDNQRSVFRFGSMATAGDEPALTIDYTPTNMSGLEVSGFSYNPEDGSSQISIKGAPGGRYKLVEAANLDFSTPDQDPVPLTSPAIVGTLDGNVVICNPMGEATVEFNLGTSKIATFIRAEEAP